MPTFRDRLGALSSDERDALRMTPAEAREQGRGVARRRQRLARVPNTPRILRGDGPNPLVMPTCCSRPALADNLTELEDGTFICDGCRWRSQHAPNGAV